MSICIVAATTLELEQLTQTSSAQYKVLITGIGAAPTVYHLLKAIHANKPSLIIQAGIAGSFDQSIPLATPVVVRQDRFADLGVYEQEHWKDVFDMELENAHALPYTNGWLPNPHEQLLNALPLQQVTAVSINEITTSPQRIQQIREKYHPAIESMEGAAFHYVCLREGIPFLQLRAISNYVGERNKSKWQIGQAIHNLAQQIHSIISQRA
ncbi:MAG TPA: futalosine hydrolase [Chitinophagaceae bacterium]|nr:futalosine hydrolase [Chitinophagaceae bacterium]